MLRKHQARFHAAVLRTLFPHPPSPPPSPPTAAVTAEPLVATVIQEECRHHVVEALDEDQRNPASDGEENDFSVSGSQLSRAQRKRLKFKKLKEKQIETNQSKSSEKTRRFIGPLLPEMQMAKPSPDPGCDNFESTRSTDFALLNDKNVTECPEVSECESGKEEVIHEESLICTKSKKRRLAKKGKQKPLENQQRDSIGAAFTAEFHGTDLIIERVKK